MNEPIKVLDKGFVRLEAFMGSDMDILKAARVSYGSHSKGEEADRKLIGYLMKNHHTSPFEQVVFKFHVKAPVFVARQWFRHRVWSYNEVSQRYKEIDDEFYIPDTWRKKSKTNKQGSDETEILDHAGLSAQLGLDCKRAYENYKWYLDCGAAKEMARFILPINIYTEFYGKVDAHNLMGFFRLRSESHAQQETRVYSDAMAQIFKEKLPWTYEAFLSTIRDKEKYPALFK